jgi:translation initiation factor IF-3
LKIPLANEKIKSQKVRLIDETGKQIGVVSLEEALSLAKEKNLDLIQVTEKVDPPVCKLGNLGKYIYERGKKSKKEKKKGGEIKGIRFSLATSLHDLETKLNQAEKFLREGKKIKIELMLKGREKSFEALSREKIDYFLSKLKEKVEFKIERELKKEGRGFTLILVKK